MKWNPRCIVYFCIGLLLTTATALAHHSISGEFDEAKPVEFTGTVKTVEWLNPHIYTLIEVKDAEGKIATYRVEGGAPNSLYRNGWRKDSLPPGTTVLFKGLRARKADSNNVNGQLKLMNGVTAWVGKGPAAE